MTILLFVLVFFELFLIEFFLSDLLLMLLLTLVLSKSPHVFPHLLPVVHNRSDLSLWLDLSSALLLRRLRLSSWSCLVVFGRLRLYWWTCLLVMRCLRLSSRSLLVVFGLLRLPGRGSLFVKIHQSLWFDWDCLTFRGHLLGLLRGTLLVMRRILLRLHCTVVHLILSRRVICLGLWIRLLEII